MMEDPVMLLQGSLSALRLCYWWYIKGVAQHFGNHSCLFWSANKFSQAGDSELGSVQSEHSEAD